MVLGLMENRFNEAQIEKKVKNSEKKCRKITTFLVVKYQVSDEIAQKLAGMLA